MIVRKFATFIGALMLLLSFGSCKQHDHITCCTISYGPLTYAWCENGKTYYNGIYYGSFNMDYWSYYVYYVENFGGICN